MSMTDTPERIWIDSEGKYPYFYKKEPSDSVFPVTEYIRADLCHRPEPAATDRSDAGKVEGDGCKRCGGKGEIVVGKGRHGDTIIEDCPSCSTPQDVINLVIAAQAAREQALDEVFQILQQYSEHPKEVVSFVMVELWDAIRALKSQPVPQTGDEE